DAGGDIEVRNVVDAVAGREIGGGEEVGLAEGKQSVPQIRIRNVNRTESVGRRYSGALAEEPPVAVRYRVQVLAALRSKADVERQRDVIRERRFEHGFGSKLVLLEAGDFLRCELPRTVGEVVNERDLHDILSQRRAAKGDRVPSRALPDVSFRSSSLKRIVV